jgi:hypothetical protein
MGIWSPDDVTNTLERDFGARCMSGRAASPIIEAVHADLLQ